MLSFKSSAELFERAKKSVAGGTSSNVRYGESPPLFFERAAGPRLYDVDGNTLIDYVLGNGTAILGHAAPAVIEAVAASLAAGQSIAGQHRGEIVLAERLQKLDSMIADLGKELNTDQAYNKSYDIQRYALEQLYMIPTAGGVSYVCYQPNVKNFGINAAYSIEDVKYVWKTKA